MDYKQPFVMAEAGCNHMGQVSLAKKLILSAHLAGADAVKFQKRNNKELLTPEQYNAPHPNPANSYGNTYGEHREFLEFGIKTHVELAKFCTEHEIVYSTSVWDLTSAKEVVEHISPDFIKIPSACNNHTKMLEYLRDFYLGKIHISLGMTTQDEETTLSQLFAGQEDRLVVYACTSGYPVPFDKLYIKELTRLCHSKNWQNSDIGFSGHHLGIAVDIAAYTLGATYIERHFTLDRTWKGTDHAASLEPSGLSKLCRDLKATQAALQYKPSEMDKIEIETRNKLKFRSH